MLNKFFFSLLSFLLALFFVLIGLVCLIFPWSQTMKNEVISFILNNSTAIFLLGFGLFVIGIARICFIISGMKRSYFHLRSGSRPIWIDESLIQNYLDNYWKTLFPFSAVSNRVVLKRNKIYLMADLPYVPISEQKELIHKIKTDLSDMFALILGYKDSFTLSTHFQPKPKEK
jgi:hypothetical protein